MPKQRLLIASAELLRIEKFMESVYFGIAIDKKREAVIVASINPDAEKCRQDTPIRAKEEGFENAKWKVFKFSDELPRELNRWLRWDCRISAKETAEIIRGIGASVSGMLQEIAEENGWELPDES